MKTAKVMLIVLSAALLAVGASTTSYAFHSGGVAECAGCHNMHNPKAGSGSFLLVGSDQSSTCLTCHEGPTLSSYHVSTTGTVLTTGTPVNRTPGGDFGWLKKNYSYTRYGTTVEDQNSHGHNIVASDMSYIADPDKTTAPGGTYASSQLGCQSCHDPHSSIRRDSTGAYAKPTLGTKLGPITGAGSYGAVPTGTDNTVGVYRLLRGKSDTYGGLTFPSGVAVAVAPSSYNKTEGTNQVRVAYGSDSSTSTWSSWCATCHPDMLGGAGKHVHPVDTGLASYAANYNAYVKSGDLSGTAATAYLSLVPFAEHTTDINTLKAHASNSDSYLNGPATNDEVMCLSCHRAHAGGFPSMLRWFGENEFLTIAGAYNNLPTATPALGSTARPTTAEVQAAYYDRAPTKFASDQRQLCNKCHAKD